MPPWLLFSLAALSLLSLVRFRALAASLQENSNEKIETDCYGSPDFLFGGALVAFFLSVIWASTTKEPQPLSAQALLTGSAFYLALVILIAGFLVFRNINPIKIFGLAPANPTKKIAFGLVWLATAYPLILSAQFLSYKLFPADAQPQPIVSFLVENPDWKNRLSVMALALFAAPLTEETIFRGYLYGIFKKIGGRTPALLASSLLFAAIHLHLPSFPGLFLLGFCLALLYEKTKSLWVPFAMHSLFNAVSVYLAIFWPELMQ